MPGNLKDQPTAKLFACVPCRCLEGSWCTPGSKFDPKVQIPSPLPPLDFVKALNPSDEAQLAHTIKRLTHQCPAQSPARRNTWLIGMSSFPKPFFSLALKSRFSQQICAAKDTVSLSQGSLLVNIQKRKKSMEEGKS